MDLAEWVAAGRWRGLLDLIDMLPAASRFNEAVANDPVAAAEIARLPASSDAWAPRVSEMDLHATMLAQVIDGLKGVQAAVIASAGGKPGEHDPFPQPRTLLLQARKEADREWAVDFTAQFGFGPDDI